MKKVPRGSMGNENEKIDSAHEICIPPFNIMDDDHFSRHNISETSCRKILVIDDDPVLVKLVSEMLEILGYEPVSCTSSPEGLRIFCDTPDDFDLIITDMSMPIMNGDILAHKIISIRKDIPIIICTGFNEYISEEQAKEKGICEIVIKPVNMKTLSDVILKAITNR
jgi:two-component system cell cycle sensor histidine kinase/response regulator CckA